MELTTSKKKIMLATILASGLVLAISQSTLAQPAQPDKEAKKSTAAYQYQMDPAMLKAHEKFMDDTVAIRKQMVEKIAAMHALMQADTPDSTKASQLAGELFELREKLRAKAKESGLPMMHMGMGMGMGMGKGRGMGMGMGMDDTGIMPCQGMGGM